MATTPVGVKSPLKKAQRLSNKVKTILIKASEEEEIDIDIPDVVLGGSVAHGTALPGHFDIDLTVFLPSLHPKKKVTEQTYKKDIELIMGCLKKYLTNQYEIKGKIEELYGNRGRRFQCWHFQVDLSLSPKWESLEDMYEHVKLIEKPSTRRMFSNGVTEFHNDLLASQPHQVKVLIKRFKAWRNETWPLGSPNGGRPKSILLSFLVLISYDSAPESVKQAKLLGLAKWITNDLKCLVSKDILPDASLDLIVPGENPLIMEKYCDILPDRPCLLDPANPFKNLYRQGLGEVEPSGGEDIKERWKIFAEEIETLDLVMNLT